MSRTLVVQLAFRYLRGKRSGNAVPVLSRISMVAIAVASCAMICLFSVFNGFEDLIKDLYKAFYPEIKITALKGKFFHLEDEQQKKLQNINGIQYISTVMEDQVLLRSNDEVMVVVLKGVDANYFEVNNVRDYVIDGRDSISEGVMPTAIIGVHIANQAGLEVDNVFSRMALYYPNPALQNISLDPSAAFQTLQLKPDGVFRIQDEFDRKYVIASLSLAQQLFKQEGNYSSVELSLEHSADENAIKEKLRQILGDAYLIQTRYEQNSTLYSIMKMEKWAVYGILVLVLLIASFNMVGALSLLILEKRKDIAILRAMGTRVIAIRSLFISEGLLWSLVGGGSGILLGVLLCTGQQYFHWIKLQGAFIIESYPVAMQIMDFVWVILTVLLVGLLASLFPAVRATRTEDPSLKSA